MPSVLTVLIFALLERNDLGRFGADHNRYFDVTGFSLESLSCTTVGVNTHRQG